MNRPLLLDTCVCLWLMDNALTRAAEQALADAYAAGLSIYISPITALEIAIMSRKQRFKSPVDPGAWFAALIGQPGMVLAPMPPKVLVDSQRLLDYPGNDPSDRIFIATAREYDFALATCDRAMLDYGAQGHLSILEC